MQNITKIINNYYYNSLILDLKRLNIIDENKILTELLNNNLSEIPNILEIIKKKNVNILKEKINYIINNDIFMIIDKNIILPIYHFYKIYKSNDIIIYEAFIKILYYIILKYVNFTKNTINFFYNNYENKIINIKHINNINKLYMELIDNNFFYKTTFINLYTNLLNKYSNEKFIYPIISNSDIKYSCVMSNCVEKGGNNNSSIIKYIDKISDNPIIKSIYTPENVKMLEEMLKNSKIDDLIQNGKLSLQDGYNKILNTDIKNINKNDDKESINTLSKIFKADEKDMENINNTYKKFNNNELITNYISDKINYQNSQLYILDHIFQQILQSNFSNNSINLKNDDIKFILMLETLESIKNNNSASINDKKNITLNVFNKDIKSTKIDDQYVEFN